MKIVFLSAVPISICASLVKIHLMIHKLQRADETLLHSHCEPGDPEN